MREGGWAKCSHFSFSSLFSCIQPEVAWERGSEGGRASYYQVSNCISTQGWGIFSWCHLRNFDVKKNVLKILFECFDSSELLGLLLQGWEKIFPKSIGWQCAPQCIHSPRYLLSKLRQECFLNYSVLQLLIWYSVSSTGLHVLSCPLDAPWHAVRCTDINN